MSFLSTLIATAAAAPAKALATAVPALLAASPTTDDAGPGSGAGFWFPPEGSTVAHSVDWIFHFILWICIFFFVLIVAVMTVFVVKYRRREGVKAEQTATHHTALELTWSIIPLILVIAIFVLGLKAYANLRTPPAGAYEVNVTAQRWTWKFDHPNGASDTSVLKIPVGRPVRLILNSEDVLHALFIPAFRVKQDVVPGRFTDMWFEADKPGTYQIFCAEYCGTQHSQMTARVEALEPEEFERQIAADAQWLDKVPDEQLYLAGYRIYARCASCHSLDGTTKTGPSWKQTHELWGKKRTLADGREVTVDENYIRNSILDPQADIVEGFPGVMPTFKGQLKDREILALIQFIKHLNEVVDDKGNPIVATP